MNKSNLKKEILKANKELVKDIIPLDKEEEEEILKSYELDNEDNIEILDDEKTLNEFKKLQNEYKQSKDKAISLRVNTSIIDSIKKISNDFGLNYQTYIGVILTQIAKGKIKIDIKQS